MQCFDSLLLNLLKIFEYLKKRLYYLRIIFQKFGEWADNQNSAGCISVCLTFPIAGLLIIRSLNDIFYQFLKVWFNLERVNPFSQSLRSKSSDLLISRHTCIDKPSQNVLLSGGNIKQSTYLFLSRSQGDHSLEIVFWEALLYWFVNNVIELFHVSHCWLNYTNIIDYN